MKNKLYCAISLFIFLVLISACKNKQSSPPPPNGDAQPQNTGAISVNAGGCLEGNEIRADGTIILENGKPPTSYEIHYLSSENATPVVVAKDMTFNPDGSFKFKGKLPDGIPLNLHETGGNIFIVFGQGQASVYNGNCEGRDGAETIDHSVFDKGITINSSSDIDIVFDEKGKMMWGTTPIKDANDFRKKLTAEFQKRKKEGKEMPGLGVSGYVSDASNELFKIFDEVNANVNGGSNDTKAQPKQATTDVKETVQFAKGNSDASLTRTIAAEGSIDFTINAKKGQKMDFTIGYDFKDSDVKGFLTEPGLKDISLTTGPKKPNEFIIKTSGNHRLKVNNTTKKKITITLYLAIE